MGPVVGTVAGRGVVGPVDGTGVVGTVAGRGVVGPVDGTGVVGTVAGRGVMGPVDGTGVVGPVVGPVDGTGVVGTVAGRGVVGPVDGTGVVGTVAGRGVVGPVDGTGVVGTVAGRGVMGPVDGTGVVGPVVGPVDGTGVVGTVAGRGVVGPVDGTGVVGTVAGRGVNASIRSNSASKTCWFGGHRPAFRNPLTAFSIVAALRKAFPTSLLTRYTLTVFPLLDLRYDSTSMLYQLFRDLKKLTSSGCILCVQWGGKDSIITPFSRAKLMASRFLLCDVCPSSRSRCLFSLDDLTVLIKNLRYSVNV